MVNPATDFWRMVWLPGLLAFTTILGLGTSVWVAERR